MRSGKRGHEGSDSEYSYDFTCDSEDEGRISDVDDEHDAAKMMLKFAQPGTNAPPVTTNDDGITFRGKASSFCFCVRREQGD